MPTRGQLHVKVLTDSASRHSRHLAGECLHGGSFMSKYLQIVPLGILYTLLGNAYMGAASCQSTYSWSRLKQYEMTTS